MQKWGVSGVRKIDRLPRLGVRDASNLDAIPMSTSGHSPDIRHIPVTRDRQHRVVMPLVLPELSQRVFYYPKTFTFLWVMADGARSPHGSHTGTVASDVTYHSRNNKGPFLD